MSGTRDHHPFGFLIWMAGGGAKPGLIYGATGEPGGHAVGNVRTIHDLHATVFHLLGLDHKNLSNPESLVSIAGVSQCAGINRHMVGDERALQERNSETILASSFAVAIVR